MKLRIARKMDTGDWKRLRRGVHDKRRWWTVYSNDQLLRAERRLRRSWSTRCPVQADGRRNLTPDWFAANRVESRRVRQAVLRRYRIRLIKS